MSDFFRYRVYLPSRGRYSDFKQLNNHQQLNTAKIIQNGDDESIKAFFDDLVHTLAVENININMLTKIDKFCVLLTVYVVSVSGELKLQIGEPDPKTVVLSLGNLLDTVTNYNQKYVTRLNINDNVSLKLKIPSNMFESDVDNIILNSIKQIHLYDTVFSFDELNINQKKHAFDQLPGDVSTAVLSVMRQMNMDYQIELLPGVSDDQGMTLGLYDNSMFEVLKMLYRSDLDSLYYNRYVASKHMLFQNEYVENISPVELKVHLKYFEKELAEQKKASEKNSQNTPSMGGIPAPPGGDL